MSRLAPALLLVSAAVLARGCLLDTRALLEHANVGLSVSGVATEASDMRVQLVDATGQTSSRTPTPAPHVEVLFTKIPRGEGRVTVRALATDGAVLQCHQSWVNVGEETTQLRVSLTDSHAGDCPSSSDQETDDKNGADDHNNDEDSSSSDCVPSVAAEAGSLCKDGQDNDCDGARDCGDADCHGTSLTCQTHGSCPGKVICRTNGTWSTCTPARAPEKTAELCSDGVDNDCDGDVDCDDNQCQQCPCGC